MSDHEPRKPLDIPTSQWLDEAAAARPTDSPERIARWQLLHALLSFTLRPTPENHDARIRSVLSAIDDERPTPVATDRHINRRSITSLITTAAVLLIVAGLWLTYGSSPTAYAVVRSAREQANVVVDRVYRVTLQPRLTSRPLREGTLYVRGGEKLAYEHPTRLGESLWLGTNGSEGWFVPPHGPVVVRDDRYYLKLWTNEDGERLPFLQVTTLLERLEQSYDLQLMPVNNGERLTHVRGIRRAGESGPQQIDMWAEPRTGSAQRVLLTFDLDSLSQPFSSVTLEIIDSPEIATDWYEHQAHHGPSRPVVHAPSKD